MSQKARRRPLRTYSKRTSPIDTVEPLPKKRRLEDTSRTPSPEKQCDSAPQDSEPRFSPALPPSLPAKKGTITSYFKAVPSSSNITLPSEPLTETTEPASTPPSSPPIPSLQQKKRRRLMTRITSRTTSQEPDAGDAIETDEEGAEKTTSEIAVSPGQEGALSEASPDTLNRLGSRERNPLEARKHGKYKKQPIKASSIQTTLSLSASEKGFTECKECDMLYNPLHKQDAKCHARRHAAMLKSKSSS
ncbi:hypothetical protein M426DRAFT_100895 [Hypoxylon sp. CI-4A]|nr:hypothetical protein M426DRAFT_100895 [Hypoxylon sp. CI-4A]